MDFNFNVTVRSNIKFYFKKLFSSFARGKAGKGNTAVWSRIKSWRQHYQNWRKQKNRLSVGSFQSLCAEIKDVAALSSRLWSEDVWFLDRVAKIIIEIEKLDTLLERREFDRLSLKKKDELRRRLIHSKRELWQRVETAPCPTERLQ